MGVTVRKKNGKWFAFVNYNGQRKAKCVGDSRAAREQVKRVIEAKLTLGDPGGLEETDSRIPTFDTHADRWLKEYAAIENKQSTARGYEGVLRIYLRPRFGAKALTRSSETISSA